MCIDHLGDGLYISAQYWCTATLQQLLEASCHGMEGIQSDQRSSQAKALRLCTNISQLADLQGRLAAEDNDAVYVMKIHGSSGAASDMSDVVSGLPGIHVCFLSTRFSNLFEISGLAAIPFSRGLHARR